MGQRERYIMRKGRQIMEDHRAISISLTSILEHSSSPYSKSTKWNRPESEFVSFPSRSNLSSPPFTFDPLAPRHPAESHLGSQYALLDDDHFTLQPHCFTPCGYLSQLLPPWLWIDTQRRYCFSLSSILQSRTRTVFKIQLKSFLNFRSEESLSLVSASKDRIHSEHI